MTRPTPPPVHFLLVDDRDENLTALDALLRRPGLVLLKARGGSEALELLLQHEVALALLDVQMPEMDGFELAELMRGTERTRRVPIIFLTAGDPDHQRRFRGYEAGAVDFLNKPIDPHALRSKAEVFFDLWRERQENARLLDEARCAADALREADRRKDEFLATLAHELRNPLAPIRNGLQILNLATNPDVAARARAMMERQLTHLVRLVDDLLDISRVATGKMRLQFEPVEVRTAADAAVETSRPAIDGGKHSLSVRLPDEPLVLRADATRLAQVIGNLLTNAAKYTPSGGQIALTAERAGGFAVVRVTDTGVGIPAEMLPKVFDLFTQVDRHLDRAQGGLGIGLSLVRRLVEMHGGTITAESEGVNRGSTFTVRIPLASAPAPVAPVVPVTPAADRRRVLVVDDNADAAESLSELLALCGHDTRTAASGPEALEVASAFRPDLVFLDIGLPGMDGYAAARAFHAAPGVTPVLVALTGWGAESDRQRSAEAGFDRHLTKPVGKPQLEELLAAFPPRG